MPKLGAVLVGVVRGAGLGRQWSRRPLPLLPAPVVQAACEAEGAGAPEATRTGARSEVASRWANARREAGRAQQRAAEPRPGAVRGGRRHLSPEAARERSPGDLVPRIPEAFLHRAKSPLNKMFFKAGVLFKGGPFLFKLCSSLFKVCSSFVQALFKPSLFRPFSRDVLHGNAALP